MQRSFVQEVPHEIEHPVCTICAAPMWLTRIEPYEAGHEQRTFECQACGHTQTEIVKFG